VTLAIMGIAICALLLLRVPIAFAILGPCLAYLWAADQSLGLAFRLAAQGINSWPLLAIPLFILVGVIANRAGIADRVLDFALAMLGRVRGSLGYVNIGVSLGFSWMSGSALADAAGLGSVEVPAMRKQGYPARFSAGLTAASTVIGPIMPPSIPAIIYAVTAGLSVGALFVAGILPALVLISCLCVAVWWMTRKDTHLRGVRTPWPARGKALLGALPAAGAGVIILGGILGGVFTPTEASAVGVLYIFLFGLIYRTLSWRKIYHVAQQTFETAGAVLLIVASAALFGWVLARERAPQAVAELILQVTNHPIVFLLLVNVFLLIIGAVLEPTAAILIVVPVLAPVAEIFGIHPMHFAAIVIFNLLLGLLTPPVGLLLFVLSSVSSVPVPKVISGVLPFFVPMLAVLLIVTFVPTVILILPRALGLVS
jgi:tripartite ATP-independent transporter DctM subunit